MKKRYFALATLALGAMTTVAFSQADRLAIQSQPAHDGTPAWHLGPSFPDPTGFTLVDADGTVHVIPREERRAMMGGAPRVPGGDSGPQCSHSPVCGEPRLRFGREGRVARSTRPPNSAESASAASASSLIRRSTSRRASPLADRPATASCSRQASVPQSNPEIL